MTRFPLLAAAPVVLLATMLSVRPAQSATVTDADVSVAPFVTGLSLPTGMRFLGDSPDDLFAIEKNSGQVKRILNGVATTVLDLNVANNSERGLLGIELHPNFPNDNRVYLYYSATGSGVDGGTWLENRLSVFTWNGSALVGEQVLRTFGQASDTQATGPNHNGGPLRFGPDGMLYGITGDLNRSRAEQNNLTQAGNSAFTGGIYRLTADGTIPADNPFVSHANPAFHAWYAYGVRNSFGITFDPLTGRLWDTENGPASYDEVNMVLSGFNSGWTKIMGPESRSASTTADLVQLPGWHYRDPAFSWLNTVAPTGLVFLADTQLDDKYRDAVLVGDANNGNLYLFRLNEDRDGFVLAGDLADQVADSVTERNMVRFGQDFGAVTEIITGPDKAVYIVSLGNGTIYRVIPEPSGLLLLLPGALVLLRRRRGA